MRLNKALAEAGVAARRTCDHLIFSGKVAINGIVCKRPQMQVSPTDQITVNDKLVDSQKKVYYVMNKPRGFECTHKRPIGKKIVYDLVSEHHSRLFSVGRLDRDTTGLLILTNDGDFANQVIHPSSNITKEYLVKTNAEITHEHLVAMSQGTEIEGVFVKPKKVKKVRRNTFKITVKEGKKREVRLIAAAAGLEVLELKRIRIGNLELGNLPEGVIQPLSQKQRASLTN